MEQSLNDIMPGLGLQNVMEVLLAFFLTSIRLSAFIIASPLKLRLLLTLQSNLSVSLVLIVTKMKKKTFEVWRGDSGQCTGTNVVNLSTGLWQRRNAECRDGVTYVVNISKLSLVKLVERERENRRTQTQGIPQTERQRRQRQRQRQTKTGNRTDNFWPAFTFILITIVSSP